MAGNITPTVAQYFIPEIWANRALETLRANVVMAKTVLRDTDLGVFNTGDILNIGIPGTFTANDKAAGSAVTLQQPSDSTVAVTLNKHKEASFLVEDISQATANQDLMNLYLEPAVVSIAEQIEKDLFGLTADLSANVAGSIGTAASAAGIRSLYKVMHDNKAPERDRTLILSGSDAIAVMGDSNLQSFFANASPEMVRRGAIGPLYGFETYSSQLVPKGAKIFLGGASGGTFTVTYGGQTTSALAYNISAANFKTAILGLSSVGAGNAEAVAVTGGFEIYFKGALAGQTASVTADFASLTGSTDPAVTISNWNPGYNRGAFVLAMRSLPIPDPSTGARAVAMRDPETGLVVRVVMAYNPTYLGQQVTVDVLYGVKTIRAAKGAILKT